MLLETRRAGGASGPSMFFTDPVHTMTLRAGDDWSAFFAALDDATASGLWAAGYFSYELGYLFVPRLRPLLDSRTPDEPLAWVGLFREPRSVDTDRAGALLGGREAGVCDLRMDTNREEYYRALAHIRSALSNGDTYQVNFTHKYHFGLEGSPEALYRDLRERQSVEYSAFIRDGERTILSLSPECFFAREGDRVRTRPMKGTIRRGRTPREDHELAEWLRDDEKNRAENVMIVDMLRNDLGRIAVPGSVSVPSLFDVERHRTLFQMTSTVEATLRPRTDTRMMMEALFPCASVTGAPKIRTMEIIAGLEKQPRGVYTGAIGYFSPHGRSSLSVAIRTIVVGADGSAKMGIGSGIVYDSDPAAEYDECVLKGKFLTEPAPEFELFETMRGGAGGVLLRNEHLERLRESARYFDFPFDVRSIERELDMACCEGGAGEVRIRLMLGRDGRVRCESARIQAYPSQSARVILSQNATDSRDPFLYHKTTHRPLYESERLAHPDYDDVVFVNERGELTEGAISNVFVAIGGALWTPPVSCGLLPGTLRRSLLESGKCAERILTLDELRGCDAFYIGNSVRGLIRATCEVSGQTLSPQVS